MKIQYFSKNSSGTAFNCGALLLLLMGFACFLAYPVKVRSATLGNSAQQTSSKSTMGKEQRSGESTVPDRSVSSNTLVIAGKVTDRHNRPAVGTTVSLSRVTKLVSSTVTDGDGGYRFSIARASDDSIWEQFSVTYVTAMQTSGPPARVNLIQLLSADERKVAVPTRRVFPGDLRLTTGSILQGIVRDDKGVPLRGTTVTITARYEPQNPAGDFLFPVTLFTDNHGRFATDQVTKRSYDVLVQSTPSGFFRQQVTPPADLQIHLNPGSASISGIVTIADTQEPLTSATVQLLKVDGTITSNDEVLYQTTQTGEDGSFTFDNVIAGNYRLNAFKADKLRFFPEAPYLLAVGDNEATAGIQLQLYSGYTLSGTVIHHSTGKPVGGVLVRASYNAQKGPNVPEAVSDSMGKFKLIGIKGIGQNQAWLSIDSKDFCLIPAQLNQGQTHSISIRLPETSTSLSNLLINVANPSSLSGTVVSEQGTPVSGAKIFILNQNDYGADRPAVATTSDTGQFSAVFTPGQKIRVRAEHDFYGQGLSELVSLTDDSTSVPEIVTKRYGTIRGKVMDEADSPVDGASILCNALVSFDSFSALKPVLGTSGESSLVSATDGSFTVTRVPSDTKVRLTADKTGSAKSKQVSVVVPPGGAADNVVLKIRKPLSISGSVVDESGKAVSGANVVCSNPTDGDSGDTKTDASGNFTVGMLGAGAYDVFVYLSGYEERGRPSVMAGTANVKIVLTRNKAGKAGSNRDQTIRFVGKVVDAESGKPLDNFTVQMGYLHDFNTLPRNSTDPGTFVVHEFPLFRSVRFTIAATDYATIVTEPLELSGNDASVERTYTLHKGMQVTGRIVNKQKKPVSGARVSQLVQGDELVALQMEPVTTVQTAEDGQFTLPRVPPGRNHLRIRAQSYARYTHGFDVLPSQATNLGDIVLSGGSTVRVKVVKGQDNVPVSGFTVKMSSGILAQPDQTTDASGVATFANVPAGQYSLRANSVESPTGLSKSITVNGNDDQEVTLLFGDAKLNVTTLQGEAPVRNAYVAAEFRGTSYVGGTDSEGHITFSQVPAGKVNITARMFRNSAAQNVSIAESLELGPGEVRDVTLRFPKTNLRGKVINSEGEPVADATVIATGSNPADADNRSVATSTKDGMFSFQDIQPGSYGVSARKDGVGAAVATGILIPDSAPSELVPLMLKNTGGTLVSTASDLDSGKPIPKAWCYLSSSAGRFDPGVERGNDGTITIPSIPPGQYRVQVSAWGFSVDEQTITIEEGKTTRIDSVLYAAGTLRWSLRKKDGAVASNVPVRIAPSDASSIEQERTGTTDDRGLIVIRGFYPGTYTATATPASGIKTTVQFSIVAKQPTDLTTTLAE